MNPQIHAIQQATRQFFLSADELASEPVLAARYVASRANDADHLMADLVWAPAFGGSALRAKLYTSGAAVVHEIVPCTLQASPCWGKIFFDDGTAPIVCRTYACFMAYLLKRFG